MKEKYINLFTDFGFKKAFGEEASKEHLISFLNTLLPERHQIEELQFCNNEYQGATALDRKAIFDLNCVSATGEYFIVELQKAKQNFFKDRSVFYATFPIQQQAQRGDWDFRLSAVYTIGILDFVFDDEDNAQRDEVIHRVQLKNQHHQVFYDKLTFIYLTLPNFRKTEDQLDTLQDKWFFLFRHLHELDDIPPRLREKVFLSLFEKASIARFEPEERQAYESSLKYYRDLKNVIDTAREEGREEGRAEGKEEGRAEGKEEGEQIGYQKARAESVLKMLGHGIPEAEVAKLLDLTLEDIQELTRGRSNDG
ncbi:Rpn family recombination-promoting nuclease/putative transposase [Methylotuvimicrobium buryatense]|uniref:Rpn family recombination-promoting nuclease/putative transposase n=1 Tax=Methylotuvimicrobium buryatense TaxID=95641 RepID=A0A4P9UJY4_METBY|nr:Rpn family recombination-promoting nuclease/putative transposase [Methylotuvimicrobium buryatense]QCW81529.1 Rpn family recombination-promoting nuclease/putative transposase [Methylotuvimicrobium buryatense]